MVGSFTASAIAAGSAWPDSGLAQNTICEEGWRADSSGTIDGNQTQI